jgi:signal transduction histidine kinase
VLGILIADPKPLRISEIGAHPERLGFPPGHPPMASFLGVPVKVRDEVYGNLYLTDKIGWSEFTGDDVALVEALSLAAGIAIENARLHDRVRRSAVYEDRDRMARDLHDTVIQRMFALGLTLQGIAARLPDGPASQIGETVHEIDQVITQVRSTIYELGIGEQSRGVRDDVTALVRDLAPVVGSEVELSFSGPVDALVSGQVNEHLLATIREALTNVGKHAQATRVLVDVAVYRHDCRLTVTDEGVGLRETPSTGVGGLGLLNLRRRAEKLRGTLSVDNAPGGGTVLTWTVPIDV